MSNRISKKVIEAVSATQFEEALSLYACSDARESEISVLMEKEITKIKEKYMGEISYLQDKKNNAIEVVQAFCKEHKEALFIKKRSYATVYGLVGFRLCRPKLKTIKGYTWDNVLQEMRTLLPDYIRTTEEVAKDMLIADRSKEKVAPFLEKIGVKIAQDEVFFIELKKEV